MAQAKTLTQAEIEQLLTYIDTRKYAARNRSMLLLTHWAGLRIGEVAGLRWSDVTTTDGLVKDEIRLLPDMTKGRHARTVFVSAKLKAELQAYAAQATCVDRSYPFFASQKKHQAWVQRQQLGADICTDLRGRGPGRRQQPQRPQDVFDALGQPRHCHSPAQDAGRAPQHQHHRCLPVQQSQFAQSGGGVGLTTRMDCQAHRL
jgi:integrase/recombinase XerD